LARAHLLSVARQSQSTRRPAACFLDSPVHSPQKGIGMTQAAHDQDRKPGSEPTFSHEIQRRFEAAWQEALAGGEPPNLQTYVSGCPEAERATLQRQLEQIDHNCRQALTRGPVGAVTVDLVAGDGNSASALHQTPTIDSECVNRPA